MEKKNIHIVLFEPEIPQNTGNIMRTCMACDATLHLIEPLGFILDDRSMKRASMDYADDLRLEIHDDLESFYKQMKGTCFYVTRYGKKAHSAFDYAAVEGDIYLMFGKESTGIPLDVLSNHLATCMRIPMVAQARSLNLSNSVAIVSYEVLRQLDFEGLSQTEVLKGEDWLLK
ncbi:MAG: tRNA (cytidine(34)-2'-O)-methyltransferase [Erysipelothrix sp.]|nr:tRNA (cytidine(34)-2'-O)-methyltransferase [Erysipelothrix sp.]